MAEAEDTDGRTQATKTPTGRSRQADVSKFYGKRFPELLVNTVEWQLTLLRKGSHPIDITGMCDSFTWSDQSSAMSGNLQLHRPKADDPSTLPISYKQHVRCRVRWGGRHSWYELWTMRTDPPQFQRDTNALSVDLNDDLDLLKGTKRSWSYRKTHNRNRGYLAHEIALLVAQRVGVKVGKLAKGTHRIDSLVKKNATALDMLKAAYAAERKASGRKFVIRMRNGRLEIVPFGRNPVAYVLRPQIQTASIQKQPKSSDPFTVLTGHAKLGKGKGAKKITYTLHNRAAVRQLGYMHHDKNYGTLDSHATLRTKVKQDLADALKVDLTADVVHSGLPFVRRGDAVKLDLHAEGFRGKRNFAFATQVDHNVDPTTYTSEVQLTSDDPYLADLKRQKKERDQRSKKSKDRTRSSGGGGAGDSAGGGSEESGG